ncbi:hypothetical protein [Mucilaginibacter paludis]|uniref:Uncharacterized protein n=1 Tax=Mucilaginibacter paludis DSM 18603 TaxID=714943 RepID=H1Y9Z0_9SPHI|nr:hypothetical protein [Mucilaginibacter paludis]EHQ24974.1 hypothetical protein Mucpa_0793 [Mucilaginibacter paludis DSM 18603]
MQFAGNLLNTSPVLAAILMTLFLFIDIVIILDLVRVCSRYYLPKKIQLREDPPPTKAPLKNKFKGVLSIYALAFGAVAYYFLQFFIWNHRPSTGGIGLLYVAVIVLLITTLLLLAGAILNKIRIAYTSRKMLAINLVVDVALLIVLNVLYFGFC